MIEPEGIETAFADRADKAREYVRLLGSVGVERGLLGPREVDRLWDRHLCNCANAAALLPASGSVADVGSGAGLPGIPLALARPDLQFTLIESMARRTAFLEEVVGELGLGSQVRVVRERAEEVFESFDAVTSRAVAPLAKLLPWCLPLVNPEGRIVALKGESAETEIEGVGGLLRRHRVTARVEEVQLVPNWDRTRVVVVEAKSGSFHVKRAGHG